MELATLPSHLAPGSDAPTAIFQQGHLDVCALCLLGNLLHAMEWQSRITWPTVDPSLIPEEMWLKGFISTEEFLKKAYQEEL
jgi:hypothetical protein